MKVAVYEITEANGTVWYADGFEPYVDGEKITPLYKAEEIAKVLNVIKELADDEATPTHELVEMIGLRALITLKKLGSV